MSWLKKLAFKHFAKIEEKKRDLSQPDLPGNDSNTNSTNPEDAKAKKKKKIIKTTLITLGVVAVVGTIIGVTVYFATRPTTVDVKLGEISYTDKNVLATTTDGKKTYKINPKDWITTKYITANLYGFTFSSVDSTLPIYFQVSLSADANGNRIFGVGADKITLVEQQQGRPLTPEQTMQNDFYKYLNIGIQNPTFEGGGFNWMSLISLFIPFIIVGLLFFLYSRLLKSQLGGMTGLFGDNKQLVKNTKTNIKFTDVAGIDEVKEELNEVVDYIKNPKKYIDIGARCPKGVILYGPPGTGKTLIAKAVAGEANCNFYPMSGSSFDDMLVGVGAKRVKELFATARKNAPSIIFIDEIDSVASKRGKNEIIGGGSGVADQTINQLLAEMDGFSSEKGVVVIAATNRLDSLDEAILRPGRFDRQIQVNLPDIKGREAILNIHAKTKKVSKNVKLLDIARRTPGFSGAQLENVLNEAAMLAVRHNKQAITMIDLDEAIDRTIGGPKREIRVMTEEEKRQISYHEAGHALVGLHTKDSMEVIQKITIIPRGSAAGYTLQTPNEQEKQIQSKQDLLNLVRMTLGGRAAEEVIFGLDKISSGAANDLYKVTKIVRAMVAQLGMSNELGLTQYIPSEGQQSSLTKDYSELTAQRIDQVINKIINEQYVQAKEIINQNRTELDLIVKTLLILETIVKEDIDYIHKYKKLPESALEELKRQQQEQKEAEENRKKEKEDNQDNSDNKTPDNNDNKPKPSNNQ